MADVHAHYLADLGALLREEALKARDAAIRPGADEFARGRAFAYYEAISLLLDQAHNFGLTPEDVGLEGLNPELELLSPTSGRQDG